MPCPRRRTASFSVAKIADDDAEAEALTQIGGSPFEEGGLARAGRGQDVQDNSPFAWK